MLGFDVFHKHAVADFDKAAAVAVGVALWAILGVVWHKVKLIKDFAGAAAGFADGHVGQAAAAPPPVLFVVVKENALARLHTALVTIGLGADVGGLGLDTFVGKNLFKDVGAFVVTRDVAGLTANKTGSIQFFGIKANNVDQKFVDPRQLLFFEVVAKAPIAQHFEQGVVAVVADFFDVLGAQASLAVGDARAFGVGFAQQVRDHGLHAAPGKERRWVILRHQQRARDNDMSIFFTKL